MEIITNEFISENNLSWLIGLDGLWYNNDIYIPLVNVDYVKLYLKDTVYPGFLGVKYLRKSLETLKYISFNNTL